MLHIIITCASYCNLCDASFPKTMHNGNFNDTLVGCGNIQPNVDRMQLLCGILSLLLSVNFMKVHVFFMSGNESLF